MGYLVAMETYATLFLAMYFLLQGTEYRCDQCV